MHLAGIFIYPVKSLRGVAVAGAAVDELGLEGDRRFMVVDPAGMFLTQRSLPRMALIETALDAGTLTLRAPGAGPVSVGRAADPQAPVRAVTVWNSADLPAEDCGEPAARWLGAFLGVACRLVRIGAVFNRPIPERKLPWQGEAGAPTRPRSVSFADAAPFLAVAAESLADLNARLLARGEAAVPMDRFRPNLVVGGARPYAEDHWTRLRIGGVTFRGGEPCARCVVTTTDQASAARGVEPLRILAGYRRDPVRANQVNFGRNLIHEEPAGALRTGDAVELL
jgi:uncharacterized protein YcbX